jgi:murein DD-endopeptidase MepM/ murein hydrolase activator NlpD
MIETSGATSLGRCWVRRGSMATAALTFACLVTVVTAPPSAGVIGEPASGRLASLESPAEDQVSASPSPDGEAQRPGRLLEVCPVDRPRHYVDDFGDARYAGGFHRHQGVDIMAPEGTPIRAPFDGKTKESGSWAGGLGVYVYGKKGFVFNAHLTKLGKQGKVKAGDVIGYVGNSGDARGGSTHDHFEWHPDGGAAVDPFRLLNAACKVPPSHPPTPRAPTLV